MIDWSFLAGFFFGVAALLSVDAIRHSVRMKPKKPTIPPLQKVVRVGGTYVNDRGENPFRPIAYATVLEVREGFVKYTINNSSIPWSLDINTFLTCYKEQP